MNSSFVTFGFDHHGKPVGATLENLREKNIHVLGTPGSGKSRLLFHICRSVIEAGLPLCVLDFKGDLYTALVEYSVRQCRARRTVLIDPQDTQTLGVAPGINPLDDLAPPGAIAAQVKWTIKHLFGQAKSVSPWIDDVSSSTLNLLTHARPAEGAWTLFEALDALKLSDGTFRERLLSQLGEAGAFIRSRFQELWRFRASDLAQIINPVKTRLAQLRFSATLTPILGQTKTTIDFDRILAKRGTFLLKAYDPTVAPQDLDLLARACFQKIKSAVFRRPKTHWKVPVYVVVDEIQRLAGEGEELADFMERGRSFGLQFVSAHQFLTQLLPSDNPRDTRVLDAIVGLSQIKCYFKVSRRDAEHGGLAMECYGQNMEEMCCERKHTIATTAFRPVLSEAVTESETWTEGDSSSESAAASSSEASAATESEGASKSRAWGSTHVDAEGTSCGFSDGSSESESSVDSSVKGSALSYPELGNSGADPTLTESTSLGSAITLGSSTGSSYTESTQCSSANGTSESESEGTHTMKAKTHGVSSGSTLGHSEGKSESYGFTRSVAPFYEYEEYTQEGGVTFVGTDEARERFFTRMTRQDTRHFVFKYGIEDAQSLKTPNIDLPLVLPREVRRFKDRVYSGYTQPTQRILYELQTRVGKFLASTEPPNEKAQPASSSGRPTGDLGVMRDMSEPPSRDTATESQVKPPCDCGGPPNHVPGGIHCRRSKAT